MAYLRFALYFANSGLENLSLDFVARHDLFRALVFNGLEFNKTQVFALFPPSAGSPSSRLLAWVGMKLAVCGAVYSNTSCGNPSSRTVTCVQSKNDGARGGSLEHRESSKR